MEQNKQFFVFGIRIKGTKTHLLTSEQELRVMRTFMEV